jgi:hypothetical protein
MSIGPGRPGDIKPPGHPFWFSQRNETAIRAAETDFAFYSVLASTRAIEGPGNSIASTFRRFSSADSRRQPTDRCIKTEGTSLRHCRSLKARSFAPYPS